MCTYLHPRAQCIQAKNCAEKVLGFISRSMSYRGTEVTLKLYLELVKPHLDYAGQFWPAYYRLDIKMSELFAQEDDKNDSRVEKLAM